MLYLISVVRQSDSVIHILSQYGLSQDVESSSLCYTVGPCCLSILHVIVCILFLLFSLSVVSDSVTPCTPPRQASLSFTVTQSLLKLMSIESVMISNHLILCCPLLLLPSIFPSIRVFPNKSALHIRWPKCWSFSLSLSNEYSGLASFRIDWFNII